MSRIDLPIPSYVAIRNGDEHATEDAIKQIVDYLNAFQTSNGKGLTKALQRFDKKVYRIDLAANTNNFNYMKVGVLDSVGSANVNLTGIIAPEEDGAMLVLHTTGSGTITVKHNDANSDADNRIISASGADRAVSTNKTLIICYLSGFWRDISFQ